MPDLLRRGTDAGYVFFGPAASQRTKTLQNGLVVGAYQQTGVMVGDSPQSPWRHATFLVQGTLVRDAENRVIRDVGLGQSTDPDGDLTWTVLWRPATGPKRLRLVAGTGKWEGISGQGEMKGAVESRADEHVMPGWEIDWQVDREARRDPNAAIEAGRYTDHDCGFSIHGPHVVELATELSNGLTLEVNTQSGVLLSENREARSPRNFATGFDRGFTVMRGHERLADIMLLEDTDPDGDVAWLYHIWWYNTGPGRYWFIGGTGKWQGISGEGKTLGVLRYRMDDHWMLRSEMHWKINREE